MAKIPLGNFGNVIAQPRPRVEYVQGAYDNGGAALVEAGNIGMGIFRKMQDEVNKTNVNDGINRASKVFTDTMMEATQHLGKNAVERPNGDYLPDEYVEKFEKGLQEIENGLGNNAQKQAFREYSNKMKGKMYSSLASHTVEQQRQFTTDTEDATIYAATVQGPLFWADKEILDESRKKITDAICARAERLGWSEMTKATEMAKALSPLHDGIIKGMVDNDRMDMASEYYQENVGTMSPAVRERAMNMINTGDFEKKTQNAAEAIWALTGGNTREALKTAQDKYDGKEYDAVIARIKRMADNDEKYTTAENKKLMDPVYTLIGDALGKNQTIGERDRKTALTPLRGADKEIYSAAAKMIDAHNDEIRNERRSAEAHARAMASSSSDKSMNALSLKYDMLNNPDKYRGADFRQSLFPLVGQGKIKVNDLEELINMQAKLRDPSQRDEFTTLMSSDERLKMRLQGSYINGKKYTDLDKEQQAEILNKARATAESVLLSRQQKGDKKIGKQEVNEIVDSMFTNKMLRDTFMGITYGKPEPITSFVPELAHIPKPELSRIEQVLRELKQPITTENILEIYNEKR